MVCGGDNKNGESKLAGRAAFNSDFNFNLYEYFHFCSKMLKKDDKKPLTRGRSSNSPCMIVFCSFEQLHTLIDAAKKHGFVNYIPLIFVKNYSPQVLKANMRVVGATEYALLLYRDRLPKFRNGAKLEAGSSAAKGAKSLSSLRIEIPLADGNPKSRVYAYEVSVAGRDVLIAPQAEESGGTGERRPAGLLKAIYAAGCNMGIGHEPNGGVTILEIPKSELPPGKMLMVSVRPLSSLGTSGRAITKEVEV